MDQHPRLVEQWTQRLREQPQEAFYPFACGLLEGALVDYHDDADALARARAVIEAMQIVRTEREANYRAVSADLLAH